MAHKTRLKLQSKVTTLLGRWVYRVSSRPSLPSQPSLPPQHSLPSWVYIPGDLYTRARPHSATMFTPPNPNRPPSSHSLLTPNSTRRRPLPARSSLSNSFSLTPQHNNGWDDSIEDLDTSSVSFAHVRRRLSISEQGNRGIGQVSPRLHPLSRRGSTSSRTVLPPRPSSAAGGSRSDHPTTQAQALPRVRSRLGHGTPDVNVTRRTSPRKKGLQRQQPQPQSTPLPNDEDEDEEEMMEQSHRAELLEDTEDEEDEDDDPDDMSWGMIDSMRLWRNDAIIQHLYETAAFWGDKILSWTGTSSFFPPPCHHLRLMVIAGHC